MIFGAVLAGGVGSRMNISTMPKQFLPLGEKPIIIHTLEKFLEVSSLDIIYVGVHPNRVEHMQSLLSLYKIDTMRVRITTGGKDRSSTVFNIIRDIEGEFGKSDEHIIVTHDGVRPFVTKQMIEDNITAAKKTGACNTVIPATDTIVVSHNGKEISEVPDRDSLYQSQTPQTFNMSLLKELYLSLTEEEMAGLTDSCKIFVIKGKPVQLVSGDPSNIKITTMSDYKIANAMLEYGCV